jgi:hypothetical protein
MFRGLAIPQLCSGQGDAVLHSGYRSGTGLGNSVCGNSSRHPHAPKGSPSWDPGIASVACPLAYSYYGVVSASGFWESNTASFLAWNERDRMCFVLGG